jgi:DNA mismatch endonuclease (patch repair protein)
MSRIGSRNTKPELILRKALHAVGLRYRLHDRTLPGTPDIVMPSRRAVIQVHGCFWHGHGCPMSVTPATNAAFWIEKIGRNRQRDLETEVALVDAGWRALIVWECALKGRAKRPVAEVVEAVRGWLAAGGAIDEISGRWNDL